MNDLFRQELEELVRIRSTADRPDQLCAAIDFAHERLTGDTGILIERFERNGKPSLVASFEDTRHFDVLLLGHVDVVEGSEQAFIPRMEDSRLYGRGSGDMKDGVVSMIHLMCHFAKQEQKPRLGLMLVSDEEVGGADGVGYLVNECGYRADTVLVPDAGGDPAVIVTRSKGMAHIQVSAQGIAGHGSRPWNGKNAIERLLDQYRIIQEHFSKQYGYCDSDWEETCNLGVIRGGVAHNVVPESATLSLDIRLTDARSAEEMTSFIQSLMPDAAVTLVQSSAPVCIDETHPAIALYAKISERHLGARVQSASECGTHDGRYFAAMGSVCIVSQALSGNHHEEGEWVDLDSLAVTHEIQKEFIDSMQKIGLKPVREKGALLST